MKRLISYFVAASFLLASCGGNASLWGQYATPTPFGSILASSSTSPTALATQTPDPFIAEVANPITPTSTFDDAFVTQEVTSTAENTPTPTAMTPTILYYAQSGDWLQSVAVRFGVDANSIVSPKVLPAKGLLDPGTLFIIPDTLDHSVAIYTGSANDPRQ